MRTLLVTLAVVVLARTAPAVEVVPGGLQVLSKDSPPVKVRVNGLDVFEIAGNAGERLRHHPPVL